jgi:predicted esterase
MKQRFGPLRFAALTILLSATFIRAEVPVPAAPVTPEETRKAFLAIIDRPKVDLAPQLDQQGVEGGIAKFHFTYASEADQRVPGILLAREGVLKDGKRHPAVIVLHGTGGSKDSELGTLRRMAQKDLIAVSIDGRYHGERGNQADYNAAIAKAFDDGKSHPLYFDTVWDVTRLIDYLQSRPDVDVKRIGLMGISKGGIETWLTAAADTRVAVAIPCISVQSFNWGLEHDAWHNRIGTVKRGFDAAATSAGVVKPESNFVRRFYDRLIPGIYTRFDGPAMLPLIAPRPLLVISGDKDPINPLQGLRLCEEATDAAYAQVGASDKFKVIVEPDTGHNVTPDAHAAAVEWFVKWLGEGKE